MRKLSFFDQIISELDASLRTSYATAPTTERPNPSESIVEKDLLSEEERKLSAKLMRINHAGEVSAQGLYRGQALTAKREDIREQMERSAMEENDHLKWTRLRLQELNSHTSLLNPCWYSGAFAMGIPGDLYGFYPYTTNSICLSRTLARQFWTQFHG